jgi:hypothetical protein
LAIAGPMFDRPLDVEVGEIVDKGRFVWVDVKLRAGRQALATVRVA